MTIDAAVYRIEWDKLPILTYIDSCGDVDSQFGTPVAHYYTANIGSATSEGVEVQASVLVMERLQVDFGGGYTSELCGHGVTTECDRSYSGGPAHHSDLTGGDRGIEGKDGVVGARAAVFYSRRSGERHIYIKGAGRAMS